MIKKILLATSIFVMASSGAMTTPHKAIKGGLLITFEGGEGSGKTVQSKLLADFLKKKGYDVILTREPGGTEGATEIRKIVLTGSADRWGPIPESLLYLAARADHWEKLIKPALNNGQIVISDRFHDSSVVYQGICKGVNVEFLNTIYKNITNGKLPDRTYLVSVNPEIGVKRSLSRAGNTETRFENMKMDFHQKVYAGFLKLAEESNGRIKVIDGEKKIEEVSKEIKADATKFLETNSSKN